MTLDAGATGNRMRHLIREHGHKTPLIVVTTDGTVFTVADVKWIDGEIAVMVELSPTQEEPDVERFAPSLTGLEGIAREMFPAEYAAISDGHMMSPELVSQVIAERDRREAAETDEPTLAEQVAAEVDPNPAADKPARYRS